MWIVKIGAGYLGHNCVVSKAEYAREYNSYDAAVIDAFALSGELIDRTDVDENSDNTTQANTWVERVIPAVLKDTSYGPIEEVIATIFTSYRDGIDVSKWFNNLPTRLHVRVLQCNTYDPTNPKFKFCLAVELCGDYQTLRASKSEWRKIGWGIPVSDTMSLHTCTDIRDLDLGTDCWACVRKWLETHPSYMQSLGKGSNDRDVNNAVATNSKGSVYKMKLGE